MSTERSIGRDSVTSSEVNGSTRFDFGPDPERPETGPAAALPPWMADSAAAAVDALPHAGQTLGARLQAAAVRPVAAEVPADEDVTPEPVVVPEFARIVPAPRKRRKPVPADSVVITAPAVVDGAGPLGLSAAEDLVDIEAVPATAPVFPAPRTEAASVALPTGPSDDPEEAPSALRRRPKWIGFAQAAGIVAVGAAVGIYAADGLGFLSNRTEADPPTAEAGAWVLNNLAGVGTVLVPSSMTEGLIEHGQDSDALTTYPDGSAADLALGKNCCDYIVLVGSPNSEPGAGLPASVRTLFDRSRPAAVFTTDGGWTQVRQVLPGSPAQVAKDLAADHAALVATGKTLISSGKVKLSDVAKQQVQGGEVDARVLIGIVAIALKHEITIASFPAQPGESAPGILRRSVAISAIDGKTIKDGSDRETDVKNILKAQSGIYHPAGAEVHPVDGAAALEFRFDAPSPFGVLTLNDEDGKRS